MNVRKFYIAGIQRRKNEKGKNFFLRGKILFLGHRVTWITLCVFGKFCFLVTGSRWSRGSRCVFLEENLIPGHRVTKLGHVCDPIVSSITSVTLVHGSQGHAGHVGHVVVF